MNVTVEIPDDRAARFEAQAQAQGLSVDQWLLDLADKNTPKALGHRTGADLVAVMQASPYREIEIEPSRSRLPVRDVEP